MSLYFRARLYLGMLGLMAWMLCGCDSLVLPADVPPFPAMPVVPPAPWPGTGSGFLLVREESGNLLILDPHGSRRQALTTDASGRVRYTQPTWSTTGQWIAWVRADLSASSLPATLVVAQPTGQVWLQAKMPFPPFYLYWNADSTQLALLSNWVMDERWTLGLNVLSLDAAADTWDLQLTGTGQPFYFAWAPQGEGMLVHHSLTQVLLQQGEQVTGLTGTAARFGAPQWSPAGQFVLYGDTRDEVGVLVQDFLESDREQVLSYFQGKHLGLFLNPGGNLLAVTETPDQWSLNALGPLFLYDLQRQTVQTVTTEPVIAVFWSPDGHRLLFYEADRAATVPTIRLRVWTPETVLDLGTIRPPLAFLQRYLPFADQYALSHRLWSPDSRYIVFATQVPGGRHAIYVQEVAAHAEPEFVLYGDLAFWSHQ